MNDAHTAVRGHLCGVSYFLAPSPGFQGLSLGHHKCTARAFTCWVNEDCYPSLNFNTAIVRFCRISHVTVKYKLYRAHKFTSYTEPGWEKWELARYSVLCPLVQHLSCGGRKVKSSRPASATSRLLKTLSQKKQGWRAALTSKIPVFYGYREVGKAARVLAI